MYIHILHRFDYRALVLADNDFYGEKTKEEVSDNLEESVFNVLNTIKKFEV